MVQGVCLVEEARSLSEFARTTVLERVKAHQYYPTLAERLDVLQTALNDIRAALGSSGRMGRAAGTRDE
jgi:hypothetical protein